MDIEEFDPDDAEELFRRVMEQVTDLAWDQQVDEEALAALYDVLRHGKRRPGARGCRPRCSRTFAP
jgi:hypothetical protein